MTFSLSVFFLFIVTDSTAHKTHTFLALRFLVQSQMFFNGKRGQEKWGSLFNPGEAREPEKLSRCPQSYAWKRGL